MIYNGLTMVFSPRFLFILLVYIFLSAFVLKLLTQNKKRLKMNNRKWKKIILIIVVFFFVLIGIRIYSSVPRENQQCLSIHLAKSIPVKNPSTPADYFAQGNYDFDRGDCKKAVLDYTKAIDLDPGYAEAYNNRAYTYMMMTYYPLALSDLNKAIEIRPDYVHALMNRGDIYNFYLINQKNAIADYDRVIASGQTNDRTVCGHRYLAMHGGWTLKALLGFPMAWKTGCQ